MAIQKIDSNVVGTRYCKEASIGTLPATASQVWYPIDPNTFTDFGGQITTLARTPISAGRSRKKGVTVDLAANGGFNIDLTQTNLQDLLQGVFFADFRRKNEPAADSVTVGNVATSDDTYKLTNRKVTAAAINAGGSGYSANDLLTVVGGTAGTAAVIKVSTVDGGGAVTAVTVATAGAYSIAPSNPVSVTGGGGTSATFNLTFGDINTYTFAANQLLFASGFTNDGNNGLKVVSSYSSPGVAVSTNLVNETPTSAAKIVEVGFQFASGDASIVVSGDLPVLATVSKDLTALGLIPGEWVWIGGDDTATKFATDACNGFARVRSVATHAIEFDKTDATMTADAGTSKTIQIFYGRVLKNELGTDIVRSSYTFERILGANDDADMGKEQAEYIKGMVPSEFTINVTNSSKATCDLTFMGLDNYTLDENNSDTLLSKEGAASAPALVEADAFNTSSDVTRMRLGIFVEGTTSPTDLFAYVTDLKLTINNSLSADKAVGVLGAFDMTAGDFVVNGNMTAYFADVDAIAAVRDNSNVTFDLHLVKSNAGLSFDLPLLTLGNGRVTVEKDKPIMLPLDVDAAQATRIASAYTHTALMCFYDYLPDVAAA